MKLLHLQSHFLATALAAVAGCHGPQTATSPPVQSAVYPKNAPLGGDLDVIVQQDGGEIELLNRTAETYPNMQLWINQQYVQNIAGLPIGQTTEMDLKEFINQRGQPYPVGGLLSPDKTAPVVLAELYDPRAQPNGPSVQAPEASPAPESPKSPTVPSRGARYRLLVRR